MRKVLFTSHVANFVKFNRPYLQWFREQGWEVHYASMGEEEIDGCDKVYVVPFHRSPYSPDNLRAYRQLRQIIDRGQYDLIHCHTPMGGVVTRLAARQARKRGTKVLYTAHGLHFYKGAPLQNWLLYYPVEKLLARVTDCLIVMNREDFDLVRRRHFPAGRIEKIDGVGVDLSRFAPVSAQEKLQLREEYGYPEDAFLLLCVAEFIPRKNHAFLLEVFREVREAVPQARLLLAGKGELLEDCKQQAAALGLGEAVDFLGYRRDVPQLCQLSDVLVSASRQEGLPVNVIEGMACGLPVVCTDVRGHRDLVGGGNGVLVPEGDKAAFVQAVRRLAREPQQRQALGGAGVGRVKPYALPAAVERMAGIYREMCGENP